MAEPSIAAGARIGHIHLKVADLDRAIRFYRDLLGFDVITHMGDRAAFLSAGGYHLSASTRSSGNWIGGACSV